MPEIYMLQKFFYWYLKAKTGQYKNIFSVNIFPLLSPKSHEHLGSHRWMHTLTHIYIHTSKSRISVMSNSWLPITYNAIYRLKNIVIV